MKYRLALDLGSTSLGWAMVLLNGKAEPCAIVRAGVRIFPDGRNPKDGSSLAVTRRNARAMRRRRDRLLKRKARMQRLLIEHGFFPADEPARKALETLNPYELRAKGLDAALTPAEFARALFHLNQRRGFKSNRRTDKKDNDSGALKSAILNLRQQLESTGKDGKARTVGELLWLRMLAGHEVRAKNKSEKPNKVQYDLYVDRKMVADEFDALWAKQAALNPAQFPEAAGAALKDCLLHQRNLRPVKPGRCTLEPDEPRAPLALPSQQRFRILQEVNHLRTPDEPLSLTQCEKLVAAIERGNMKFEGSIPKLLGLPGSTRFNLADKKRQELKGNTTSVRLSKKDLFGPVWHDCSLREQDAIVRQLINQESQGKLVKRLVKYCGVDEARAERIADVTLEPGFGALSSRALSKILPRLQEAVVTYAEAARRAGYHHSQLSENAEIPGLTFAVERVDAGTGEIKRFHTFKELPYYGQYLQRHVGFGSGELKDPPEKRFGRIANPTVHIGLNQVRVVVNTLIKRYGHPTEVIVEVARELKQSQDQRRESHEQQTRNQTRNKRIRQDIADAYTQQGFARSPDQIKRSEVEKWILWEELSDDSADRRCPYSGVRISAADVLSERTEIDHILPFSMTLDDSLNNKTMALRQANRIKGNRTPWDAREDFAAQSWDYDHILLRTERIPIAVKRQRFRPEGYEKWLKGEKGFLPRALNDTRYLSRVAREYLSLICPADTRVIPGRMTAELRRRFGLNDILGLNGEKNRDDHRHHAVDACVVAVTDQGLLQRFAQASADARGKGLDRLVETMPDPWLSYREHVRRAVNAIWVSHKPDHGYEGSMFKATAFGIRRDGSVVQKLNADGEAGRTNEYVVPIAEPAQLQRHGLDNQGQPRAYKGYVPDGNFCIEIVNNEAGKWQGEVTATFEAYAAARERGAAALHDPAKSLSGKPLVMRLMIDDLIRLEIDGRLRLMRIASINAAGRLSLADHNEANVDARNRDKNGDWRYTYKQAGSLKAAKGRRVTVSPSGELRDPGFKE